MAISRLKKVGCVGLIVAAIMSVSAYYYFSAQRSVILDFDPVRDTQQIVDMFEENRYWLTPNDDTSIAFLLKHRTPYEVPHYFGTLKIKVLREKDNLLGFVTYFMEKPGEGRILFLAVGKEFRGKKYGQLLIEYAMDDLIAMGAKKMGMWTRMSNFPAQRIYKGLGFSEVYEDPAGYIFFSYTV